MLDRRRLDAAGGERVEERAPPRRFVASADCGETPRRGFGPAVVEQAVQREVAVVEDDVLEVRVPHARQSRDNGERVHLHPEEMARVDVRGEIAADRGELPERLEVVDESARMQLDADQDLRVLAVREVRDLRPVRRPDLLPLPLVLALEVRQPAPGGEARPYVAGA